MKTLKIIFSVFLALSLFGSAKAANIDTIETLNNKTLNVTSTGVTLGSEEVKAELKILKDISISFAGADLEDTKKVILDLSEDLSASTSYNLIGLIGSDANVNFTTGENITDEVTAEYALSEGEQSITQVTVVDLRTIELNFSQDLTEGEFEFELLFELGIDSTLAMSENMFQVKVEDELESQSDYIFMVLSLEDSEGNFVELEEDLHYFTTPDVLEMLTEDSDQETETSEEAEEVGNEATTEDTELTSTEEATDDTVEGEDTETRGEVVMNAASEDESNVEAVSAQAEETPETGTATNILLVLTVLATSFVFMRKKLA